MHKITIYQVDAFSECIFSGNPAAICPLDDWLPNSTMQAIAAEMNLSETAFFIRNGDKFDIRWFTPMAEVDLAGHPTLAAAHILFRELEPGRTFVQFSTQIGDLLSVESEGDILTMDFPSRPPKPKEGIKEMGEALGACPLLFMAARDAFAVFEREEDIRRLKPDMAKLAALDYFGTIVTAPGGDVDFVSRFFAPRQNIPEDPVTGSAHCELIPYWAKKLNKTDMVARQLSVRGGEIYCSNNGPRVKIGGKAVTFMRGELEL